VCPVGRGFEDLRFEIKTSGAPFGGGRALPVLKLEGLVSTRTPFLHREERVETRGYEFNRQATGGNSGDVGQKMGEEAVRKRKKLLWVS
jgi:hypothetical protein